MSHSSQPSPRPELVRLGPSDPRAEQLFEQQQQELRARYGGEITTPFAPGEADLLLACQEDGQLIACGALQTWPSEASTAEVRRMYTAPQARGRGLARQILSAVIEEAAKMGYRRLVVQTGRLQPEAQSMYQRLGFVVIPNFAPYVDDEKSVCFERLL